mmetsp:Transcript_53760/g.80219  ORF Transcript_53760/g.80219 Transcript_53760/m.80219 type:complete len:344 (-) Transcript_53760:166-1197(-)
MNSLIRHVGRLTLHHSKRSSSSTALLLKSSAKIRPPIITGFPSAQQHPWISLTGASAARRSVSSTVQPYVSDDNPGDFKPNPDLKIIPYNRHINFTVHTIGLPERPAGVDPTDTSPKVYQTPCGKIFAWSPWLEYGLQKAPDGHRHFSRKEAPKVKPGKVQARLEKMRCFYGRERQIRHSPFRMQLICQMVQGLALDEALQQLQFLTKIKAPLLSKVLTRTANIAQMKHGLQHSQLELAECFATPGKHIKKIKYRGKGHFGIMHHRHCHVRIKLREIDFPLKIVTAPTIVLKRRWVERQLRAELDYAEYKVEFDEEKRLEAIYSEQQHRRSVAEKQNLGTAVG